MKQHSQRGAARISAIWLIVMIVLFFVALFFGYTANTEKAASDEALSNLESEAVVKDEEIAGLKRQMREISELLGYYDREDLSSNSVVATAQEGLNQMKDSFDGMGADIENFEDAWPIALQEFRKKVTQIQTLNDQVQDTEGRLMAARSEADSAASELRGQLSTVQSQLKDAEDLAASEKSTLESTISQVRGERDSEASNYQAQRNENDDQRRSYETEITANQTRMKIITDQVKFQKNPQGPDGKVLEVSSLLPLGYINRGASDRISRGLVFAVHDGNPARDVVKGFAVVQEVHELMSRVRFYDLADPNDPIVSGDVIHNPLYDPDGERNAVLAGRFSGSLTQRDLELMLEEIGIHVQSKMDLSTTYLVVGEALFTDPETGEPAEDPIPVSDLDVYKDAVAQGVNIVHVSDLRQYFKK